MVSQERIPEARKRILAAAEAEFSAHGFDGARIDAIAARAEVNKALIYYYFKSKAGLLDVLLEDFFVELKGVQTAVAPLGPGEAHAAYWQRFMRADVAYLKEHLALMRIVLLELLKGGSTSKPILGRWKQAWQVSDAPQTDEASVFGFFFCDLPLTLFHLLQPAWSDAVGLEARATEETFLELTRSVSDAYYNGRIH